MKLYCIRMDNMWYSWVTCSTLIEFSIFLLINYSNVLIKVCSVVIWILSPVVWLIYSHQFSHFTSHPSQSVTNNKNKNFDISKKMKLFPVTLYSTLELAILYLREHFIWVMMKDFFENCESHYTAISKRTLSFILLKYWWNSPCQKSSFSLWKPFFLPISNFSNIQAARENKNHKQKTISFSIMCQPNKWRSFWWSCCLWLKSHAEDFVARPHDD